MPSEIIHSLESVERAREQHTLAINLFNETANWDSSTGPVVVLDVVHGILRISAENIGNEEERLRQIEPLGLAYNALKNRLAAPGAIDPKNAPRTWREEVTSVLMSAPGDMHV